MPFVFDDEQDRDPLSVGRFVFEDDPAEELASGADTFGLPVDVGSPGIVSSQAGPEVDTAAGIGRGLLTGLEAAPQMFAGQYGGAERYVAETGMVPGGRSRDIATAQQADNLVPADGGPGWLNQITDVLGQVYDRAVGIGGALQDAASFAPGMLMREMAGPEVYDQALARGAQQGAERQAGASEEVARLRQSLGDDFGAQVGFDVSSNLVNMLPGLAAGFATGNPIVGASLMGAQVGSDTYGRYRAEGKDPAAAAVAAKAHAFAETVTEAIPLGALIRQGSAPVKRLLEATFGEGAQEALTEVIQSTYDATELEGMTLQQALVDIDWGDVAYAGALGALIGGTLAVSTEPLIRAQERAAGRRALDGALDDTALGDADAQARAGFEVPQGSDVEIGDQGYREGEMVLVDGIEGPAQYVRPHVNNPALAVVADATGTERVAGLDLITRYERRFSGADRQAAFDQSAPPPADTAAAFEQAATEQEAALAEQERIARQQHASRETEPLGYLASRVRGRADEMRTGLLAPDATAPTNPAMADAFARALAARGNPPGEAPAAEQALPQQESVIAAPEPAQGVTDEALPGDEPPQRLTAGDVRRMTVEAIGRAHPPEDAPNRYADPRLKREWHRGRLKQMVEQDMVEGGGIALVMPDPQAGYKSDATPMRTKSVNPSWAQSLIAEEGVGRKQVQRAVYKALAGQKLGVREARIVSGLLDQVTGERSEDAEFVRGELAKARALRKQALPASMEGIDQGPEFYPAEDFAENPYRISLDEMRRLDTDPGDAFEESEYDQRWDGEQRAVSELAAQANEIDEGATERVLIQAESENWTNARIGAELGGIIYGRGRQQQQEQPVPAAGVEPDQGAQGGQAEVQGKPAQAAQPAGERFQLEPEETVDEVAPRPLPDLLGSVSADALNKQNKKVRAKLGESRTSEQPAPTTGGGLFAQAEQQEFEKKQGGLLPASDKRNPQGDFRQTGNRPAEVSFAPTHELPDGTRVRATDEDGVFVDADGVEVEDSAAVPIEQEAAPETETQEMQRLTEAMVFGSHKLSPGQIHYVARKLGMNDIALGNRREILNRAKAAGLLRDNGTLDVSKLTKDQRKTLANEIKGLPAERKDLLENARMLVQNDKGEWIDAGTLGKPRPALVVDNAPKTQAQQEIERVDAAIKKVEAQIEDWKSREYKPNEQKLTFGNEDTDRGEARGGRVVKSIGDMNERRRQRTIRLLGDVADGYRKLKADIQQGRTTLADYKDAVEANGRWQEDVSYLGEDPISRRQAESATTTTKGESASGDLSDIFAGMLPPDASAQPENVTRRAVNRMQGQRPPAERRRDVLMGDAQAQTESSAALSPRDAALARAKTGEYSAEIARDIAGGRDAITERQAIRMLRDLGMPEAQARKRMKSILELRTTPSGAKIHDASLVLDAGQRQLGIAKQAAPATQPATAATVEPTSKESLPVGAPADPLEAHRAIIKRLDAGEITADELRAAWADYKANRDAIEARIAKMTKPQIFERYPGMQWRWKNEKKARVVRALLDFLGRQYHLGEVLSFGMDGPLPAIDKAVAGYTDADIAAYAERVAKAKAERAARVEAMKKAVTNPQTYDEFRQFIELRGADALTSEQRVRWDEIQAERIQEKRQKEVAVKATVTAVDVPQDVGMELVETTHTRDGYDLFVVRLTQQVERPIYDDLLNKARQLGGWWPRFRGAKVRGFHFKTREAAEKFMALREGDQSRIDQAEDRQAEKVERKTSRLAAAAERLRASAEEKLSADRQTNTSRRAAMAASAEASARADLQLADTMANLAEAIASGKAKHLGGLANKAQIEQLDSALREARQERQKARSMSYSQTEKEKGSAYTNDDIEHARMPAPLLWKADMVQLAAKLASKPGAKMLARKLAARARAMAEDTNFKFTSPDEIATVREILAKADEKDVHWYMRDRLKSRDRLVRAGIETDAQLRAALREYLDYRGGERKADPVKELERKLAGNANVGVDFFPTPPAQAAHIVGMADIKPGMSVLEPSAGNGHLADAARDAGGAVDVVELSGTLREILEAKGHNIVGNDFTDFEPGTAYDRIIMNPPFSNRMDAEHVRRAYDMLKPGGRLVSIMGEGVFFGSDKKATEFREWLESVGGTSEKLPEGFFMDRANVRTTGVNSRVVVIDKDEGVRFDAGGTAPDQKATLTAVQRQVDRIAKRWPRAPKINVVANPGALPEHIRRAAEARGIVPNAAWDSATGEVYLVASRMGGQIERIRKSIAHETIGHAMVEEIANEGGFEGGFDGLVAEINRLAADGKLGDIPREIGERWGYQPGSRNFAAEVLPVMVERRLSEQHPAARDLVARVLTALRNWLRKMGFGVKWSRAELRDLVRRAEKRAGTPREPANVPGPGVGESQFSADTPRQTDTPEFRRWFGNSKVVDKNGEPLVVYHGTGEDFDTFSADEQWDDIGGFWFSDAGGYARWVADGGPDGGRDGIVKDVYLRIENPMMFDVVDEANREAEMIGVDRPETPWEAQELLAGSMGWNSVVKDLVFQAKAQGHDGLVITSFNDNWLTERNTTTAYIAFEPSQVKSAIGNRGTFDPADDRIQFMASGPAGPQGNLPLHQTLYLPPKASTLDRIRFRVQDKFIAMRRAQEAAPNPLPSDRDPYRAEELYHGKVTKRLEDFHLGTLEPLVQAVAESGLEMAEIGRWLHARHAAEANQRLREINPNRPNNNALSGMTDADAAQILADNAGNQVLQRIGGMVDAMNRARLNVLEREGLESPDIINAMRQAYLHYVPLMREDAESFEGSTRAGGAKGRGFSAVTGRDSKVRGGSNLPVDYDNMLAHMVAKMESTLIRAEKQKVANALLDFVVNNPAPDLWEVDKKKQSAVLKTDPATGLQVVDYAVDPREYDNQIKVRDGATVHTISFNMGNEHAKQIVTAMKNLDSNQQNGLISGLLLVNRYLSWVNTSANPQFILSNALRDLQTAAYNLQATDAEGLAGKIIADVPKAWNGIRQALRGANAGSQWARYFDEFERSGARTGWIESYRTIEDRTRRLNTMVKMERGDGLWFAGRGAQAMLDWISDQNAAVENAVRLSAFVNARQAGMSESDAASLAKNLTVNFNRKGDWGPTLNGLYLFYNASIQGVVTMLRAARHSRKVQGLMAGTVAFSAALEVFNALAGGDDDESGLPAYYAAVDEKIKERYMVFMVPGGGGEHVKIPLPWGYNVLHVMGQEIGKLAVSRMDPRVEFKPGHSAARVVVSILEAFNPVQGGSALQTVAPTFLDPAAQIAENKDWAGNDLAPEPSGFGPDKPYSERFWGNPDRMSVRVARALNEIAGGNAVRSSGPLTDISPEWIDMLLDTAAGGAGRFLKDLSLELPTNLLTGEPIETRQIPMVRTVFGSKSLSADRRMFWENVQAVELLAAEDELFKESKDREGRKAHRAENGRLIAQASYTDRIKRKLAKIRNRIEGIRERDDLDDQVKRDMIREQRARMDSIYQRYNQRINRIRTESRSGEASEESATGPRKTAPIGEFRPAFGQ